MRPAQGRNPVTVSSEMCHGDTWLTPIFTSDPLWCFRLSLFPRREPIRNQKRQVICIRVPKAENEEERAAPIKRRDRERERALPTRRHPSRLPGVHGLCKQEPGRAAVFGDFEGVVLGRIVQMVWHHLLPCQPHFKKWVWGLFCSLSVSKKQKCAKLKKRKN